MSNVTRRVPACALALLALLLVLTALPVGARAAPSAAAPSSAGLIVPTADPPPSAGFSIPTGREPTLDGSCDDFSDVAPLPFSDGAGTGNVYLKTAGGLLYTCIQATPGTFNQRFASVYLDPQGDGASYEFAAKDDFALRVNAVDGARSTFNGTDVANGYTPNAVRAGSWDGKSIVSSKGESFEYVINYREFGIAPCKLFGIAGYHHWFSAVGDDYGWPSNTYFDQPRTWKLARIDNGQCAGQNGRIAYVYRGDAGAAASFFNLLVGAGYTVQLVPLSSVLSTTFREPTGSPNFDLIIVADDTGNLDSWGSTVPLPDISPDQVARLRDARLPIIGLGEGGYAFFGQLSMFIGWPQGWHGSQQRVNRAPSPPAAYYNGVAGDPVTLYSAPSNTVGIYLDPTPLPTDVFPIGLEDPTKDHASIIQQNCRLLWGFSDDANAMSGSGQQVFLNAVGYMRGFQCPVPPQPQPECTVSKTADPPSGTAVTPGQVIRYTIMYANCSTDQARVFDPIPNGTIYVPDSAGPGATLRDGVLGWSVPSPSGSVSFKVWVKDTECNGARKIVNEAKLAGAGGSTPSNVVTHPLNCPPITLPNDEPPYAESEIQIHPYPFVTGRASRITVQVSNSSDVPQPVKVSFRTSPQRFGIGINFTDFDSKVVIIPPRGNAVVESSFTPVSSGHYCIEVRLEDASPTPRYKPFSTSRNIDVNENLKPGVPDDLVFKVANPKSVATDIRLTVDNTCPGWRAEVIPALLTGVGPNGADVRDAILRVTPPDPVVLGSGCHIDVQGWIGDELIGGIRKLDVPPVQLPRNVQPPWEEPEITLVPNPPAIGQAAQICVELQNPQPFAKRVRVKFAVADLGAGVPFTTVATREFDLPANSINRYCAPWTPASGTLHRCILVTLEQAGYLPMTSQRNVDLRRLRVADLVNLDIPFRIGNQAGVPRRLELRPVPWGLDPRWRPRIIGDPPPDVLAGGQVVNLRLGLERVQPVQSVQSMREERFDRMTQQAAEAHSWRYGSEASIKVTALLDGVEVGGFTVQLDSTQIYAPMVVR